jgi:hydrogenase maturation factor
MDEGHAVKSLRHYCLEDNMSDALGLGKVTKDVFRRSVLPFIPVERDPELDGATIDLTGRTVIAHSPSIGVPLEALGFFAFHYSASNVACKFGRPTHLITGIYLPLRTREADLRTIARSLGDEARRYEVVITAGQTATYYGLQIPLITSTCLGEALRAPSKPVPGDKVLLIGEVGGEGVWLKGLDRGEESEVWRRYTPLPAILGLQDIDQVKVMHDVSEGGVKGSLYEVADSLGVGLSVDTEDMVYAEGAERLDDDLLRAPSYGALVAIVDPEGVNRVKSVCASVGWPAACVGEVVKSKGLKVDGVGVTEQKRVNLDEIYGLFQAPRRDP